MNAATNRPVPQIDGQNVVVDPNRVGTAIVFAGLLSESNDAAIPQPTRSRSLFVDDIPELHSRAATGQDLAIGSFHDGSKPQRQHPTRQSLLTQLYHEPRQQASPSDDPRPTMSRRRQSVWQTQAGIGR